MLAFRTSRCRPGRSTGSLWEVLRAVSVPHRWKGLARLTRASAPGVPVRGALPGQRREKEVEDGLADGDVHDDDRVGLLDRLGDGVEEEIDPSDQRIAVHAAQRAGEVGG